MDVIEIDGSLLEGGGQVLRNCTAYAAILHKRAHIVKIRANRSRPGLRPQALVGLKLIATLTQGTLVGAFENSEEILFTPGEEALAHATTTLTSSPTSTFEADVKTAGSCALILQVAVPVLLFARNPTSVVVKGGTNVSNSPPIDYMQHVLIPVLQKHCHVHVDLEVVKRGFMPRGGGVVKVRVHPQQEGCLAPIRMLERGDVVQVVAQLFGVDETSSVGLVKATVRAGLDTDAVEFECEVRGRETRTKGKPACGVFLYARTSTGCVLGGGSLGSAPATVASVAVQDLVRQLAHGGCTDEHLQDQLIIFMALAGGVSEILTGPITLHTETAIHFARHMTSARISVSPVAGGARNVIRCHGMGYVPPWVGSAGDKR